MLYDPQLGRKAGGRDRRSSRAIRNRSLAIPSEGCVRLAAWYRPPQCNRERLDRNRVEVVSNTRYVLKSKPQMHAFLRVILLSPKHEPVTPFHVAMMRTARQIQHLMIFLSDAGSDHYDY